ncbi:MAG: zinc ABC transporter substrate-binding protein [Gemmatimonadetes bacterium]|nr:zinc ABC transporter substrate-binding protein [Gemmatimonadota bacterium]
MASIFPIADIAAALGGPAAHVDVLLPPGASPETFEPTPDVVRKLAAARLFITVGGGLDTWTRGLVEAADSGVEVLTLSEGIELRREGAGAGTGNPHVWLDPVLVRDRLLPRIAEALERLAPGAAQGIRQRASAYGDSLSALDAEIRTLLEPLASRAFVAAHPAWVYFAERYRLRQLAAIRPAPGQEPSPRHLAALVDSARALAVHVVFAEPQTPSAEAAALADEIGAQVRILDPLGGPGTPDRDSYLALLRYNARELAAALGRQG